MSKAVVLLSGGVDSSTVLYMAKGEHEILAVGFDYGQKHFLSESNAAYRVSELAQVPYVRKRLNPSLFTGSALTSDGVEVPSGTYDEAQAGRDGPISTYVPFRNGQLISAAAAIAVQNGASWVFFAAHASDYHRWAYPDCSPSFVKALGTAIEIGTDGKVKLAAPIIGMTKDQVVAFGSKLGVPYHLTWSCYRGETMHCGVCPTCNERKSAFQKAGIQDPTEYAASVHA